MDAEKIRKEFGYAGKPKQWQVGFDALLKHMPDYQKEANRDSPVDGGVSFDAAIREVDIVIKSLKWFKTSGIPEDKKPVYAWAADLFVNLRKELCKIKN